MKASAVLVALVASSVSAQAVASANAQAGVDFSGDGDLLVTAAANAVATAAAATGVWDGPDGGSWGGADDGSSDGGEDDTDDEDYGDSYPDCTQYVTDSYTSTITGVITSTWCPVCDEAKSNGDVYTTTYETVYTAVCPTGLSTVTYLVSQTCTGTTPIDTATCPPGFVETSSVCTACEGSPTITVTEPCPTCPQYAVATATHIIAVGPAEVTPYATGSYPASTVEPFLGAASSSYSLGLITLGASLGCALVAMILL